MTAPFHTVVETTLRGYADSGVLRSFAKTMSSEGGASTFCFIWHGGRPLRLICDDQQVVLRDFLPNIPAHSDLYADLKEFLKQCAAPHRPPHRRADPTRAAVRCTNRAGRVSVALSVRDSDFNHATRVLLNLAHELWLHMHSEWTEYTWENLNAPQE